MALWSVQGHSVISPQAETEEVAMWRTDTNIERMVENELEWDPIIDAKDIAVQVKDGVVTLAGFARNYIDKYEAERVVKRVLGVKAVANDIDVQIPSGKSRIDPDIAHDAIRVLEASVPTISGKLKTIVRDGWVTLEGDAEWDFQRQWAESAVHKIKGVRGVTNSIHLKPKVNPTDLKAKIEQAFERNAHVDAGRITVEADGGTVTLRGQVRTWAEREDAAKAASRAPGVTDVRNRIDVDTSLQSAIQSASGVVEVA
jgi:osmotically-inducible protein OsmY